MTLNDFFTLLRGAAMTIELAAGTIPAATLLATLLVILAVSSQPLLRLAYRGLLWVIRGTPLALLALLVFYALAAHAIRIGPVFAGILVLSIYFSVLYAEVIRGALRAIPRSTFDSARGLGLPSRHMLRKVIVPLLLRQGLPAYVNMCVMTIKSSSILSIIGVWELTYASREIVERNLAVFPVLSTAAALYFVICFAADRYGRWVERRLERRGFSAQL
jgi:polar amino acid transport system permease protein